MTTIRLKTDELGTVLAALRYWQEQGLADDPHKRSDALHDIATSWDAHTSLTGESVDALCERINVLDDDAECRFEVREHEGRVFIAEAGAEASFECLNRNTATDTETPRANAWRVVRKLNEHGKLLDALERATGAGGALSEAWEIGAGHNKPTFEQLNRWHAALAALKAAQSALNQIPCKPLSGEHKDSYAVASLVDAAVKAMEGGR